VSIALIPGDTLLELLVWGMLDQLREDGAASIHPPLFRTLNSPSSGSRTAFGFQIVPAPNARIPLSHRLLLRFWKI
jgi:hypothetical protein